MVETNLLQEAKQLYSLFHSDRGGSLDAYLTAIALKRQLDLPVDRALEQVALEPSITGLTGFHFAPVHRNLYLFCCTASDRYQPLAAKFQQLLEQGLPALFAATSDAARQDSFAQRLRSLLVENRAVVDQVFFRFLFAGDLSRVRYSQTLLKLREDLEDQKWRLDEFFGRRVALGVQYFSTSGEQEGIDLLLTRTYELPIDGHLEVTGPDGQLMHIVLVPLRRLGDIFQHMGPRFLDRNIRHGLGKTKAANRAIARALREIVIDELQAPGVFPFHHNGVTLASVKVEVTDQLCRVTEPRVLNGAQTLTTLLEFLEKHRQIIQTEPHSSRLNAIRVLCKLITNATGPFVTSVTINNNRQNPVAAWHLRAHDPLQLELQDRFAFELGIFYERQEGSFQSLSKQDKEAMGLREQKRAIQMTRLARTILIAEGALPQAAHLQQVFEDDEAYSKVFNPARVKADLRRLVLCYKIRDRLRKCMHAIEERGPQKYWFVSRAGSLVWSLLCQGVLNDPKLEQLCEDYGNDLVMRDSYADYLLYLASARSKPLLSWLITQSKFARVFEEGNLGFLSSTEAWREAMGRAGELWGWTPKKLQ